MPIYTAVISGDTGRNNTAGGTDQFEITAAISDTGLMTVGGATTTYPNVASNVKIREVRLGQYTEFGDAASEIVGVKIIMYRGGDTGGGGSQGLTVTPSAVWGTGDTGGGNSIVTTSNDVLATDTGIPGIVTKTIISDVFNVASGWWYYPPEEEMIVLESGDRLVVRTTAFADPTTINGTMVYEEIGKRGDQ
jgi:hypothetical protein